MRFEIEVSRRFVLFPASLFLLAAVAIVPGAGPDLRAGQTSATKKLSAAEAQKKVSPEALRLNTLGVAYMNQGKSADARKYFERALLADPGFAQAKMNLGIALLAQQKLEQARAALEQASAVLPNDPYAWYNLGLAYKDSNEPEKAVTAFQQVEKIAPDEPDAFYFEGFLLSQLQKYDDAIGAFQKALAIAPYHASAQFGLARAYQRKGETDAAREAMKHFQKLTTDHLGTPFGAGYGDQENFRLQSLFTAQTRVPRRKSPCTTLQCRFRSSHLAEPALAPPSAQAAVSVSSIMTATVSLICFSWASGEGRVTCCGILEMASSQTRPKKLD